MKKHLSRAWDDIVLYLNLPLGLPFDNPQSTYTYPTFSFQFILYTAVNQALPVPCQLSLDQTAVIVEKEGVLRQLLTSNEALKAKLRVLAAVKMQNYYLF